MPLAAESAPELVVRWLVPLRFLAAGGQAVALAVAAFVLALPLPYARLALVPALTAASNLALHFARVPQARVRALTRRRQGGTAAPVLSYGDLNFDTVSRIARIHGRTLSLSMHEAGVLEVLLNRFGRVVSKEQLVEQLYSYDREVSQNAIEVYVSRLRAKLEPSGIRIRTVRGFGYMLEEFKDRKDGN